jgi:NADH:ubiquinone oxidoreductase subunit K
MTETWVGAVGLTIVGLFVLGLYALVARRNLVKVLLGMEVLGKAASLTFILAGYLLDDLGRAQAIVFTIIVIEVVVTAVALALMVNVYRTAGSLSVQAIRRLRG